MIVKSMESDPKSCLIYGVVKSGKPFDAEISLKGLAIQDGI
ncbi:hypothetical protein [Methylophilus sp. TWE2]|nr:hypothetical protein [Methylophilus sp. TWE2]